MYYNCLPNTHYYAYCHLARLENDIGENHYMNFLQMTTSQSMVVYMYITCYHGYNALHHQACLVALPRYPDQQDCLWKIQVLVREIVCSNAALVMLQFVFTSQWYYHH